MLLSVPTGSPRRRHAAHHLVLQPLRLPPPLLELQLLDPAELSELLELGLELYCTRVLCACMDPAELTEWRELGPGAVLTHVHVPGPISIPTWWRCACMAYARRGRQGAAASAPAHQAASVSQWGEGGGGARCCAR